MSDLITQLKQDPFQFGLFQAASLLERIAQGQGGASHWGPSEHPVRFKSDITLGFPAGDIHSIRSDETGSYQVYTSLMCLAGSRGPLPLVFTEMLLASRRNKDHAPVDFLDVFNHRLLHLLYQAKQKYHLSLGARGLSEMPLLRFVDASASLGFKEKKGLGEEAVWLKHAALMGAAPRSMRVPWWPCCTIAWGCALNRSSFSAHGCTLIPQSGRHWVEESAIDRPLNLV